MNGKKVAKSGNKKPDILLKETKEQQVLEMKEKVAKMREDREAKCKAAKEQLVDMLKVTVDKYRTVTGTAEALRVLRFVYGDDYGDFSEANELAFRMAKITGKMAVKAERLSPEKMDKLCEDFYDMDFKHNGEGLDFGLRMAEEMMRIDLCRNVGESAMDMVSFCERSAEEIGQTKKAIEELEK